MKGLKCFLFLLLVLFCSFFFISTPVQALRESSNITYWVSEGGVWIEPGNTKYPFNLTIESFGGNNFQISPSRGINEQSGTQTQRENVWLVRTWFRLPRSIQNSLGARFTVYGIFYPNSILDGGWQCGDNTGLNSSITGNGVVARLEEVHCTEVRDSQGLQALRLYSTFTLSPLYGSTFTDNPELYITWNSSSREYGIFNFDGYLITSGLSDSSSGLYMASHLDIDDLTLFTDPNTGVLNQQLDVQIDINNNLKEVNDSIQEQTDWLKDDTPPNVDVDSALADSAGWLPAGPVDSILTLPITFMQGIVNVLTGSDECRAVNLPLPFVGGNLVLPCMRPILNQMGFLTIYEVVGSVVSMFIIWNTLKWLYEFVDKTLTFREDNSGLWGGL